MKLPGASLGSTIILASVCIVGLSLGIFNLIVNTGSVASWLLLIVVFLPLLIMQVKLLLKIIRSKLDQNALKTSKKDTPERLS